MEKIKVRIKDKNPNSNYGYYKCGDTGVLVGFSNFNCLVLKDDGKFVVVNIRNLEAVKEDAEHFEESEKDDDIHECFGRWNNQY